MRQRGRPGASAGHAAATVVLLGCLAAVAAGVGAQSLPPPAAPFLPPIDRHLPALADRALRVLDREVSPVRAFDMVRFMDRFWRLAGNPGFEASQDLIRDHLVDAGFRNGKEPAAAAAIWYEEFPNRAPAWEQIDERLSVVEEAGGEEVILSRERDHVSVCINSFPTAKGGVTAPLVYVGRGVQASDYEGLDVRGAVVLGDGPAGRLWTEAVRNRGAIGVVSAAPPPSYTRPQDTPDVFQWGSIPYDAELASFGFKAHQRAASRLRARLAEGRVRVRVEIESRFHQRPNRSLVAEIRGARVPDERVVLVAHVQEPGANDNASGCATLLEIARGLQAAIAAGRLPRPSRTLSFVWGDEIAMSRQYLAADPARTSGVRYAFSLDMTGEDTAKTGGTFLIEKMPDPTAVWSRPSDPHTQWGGSPLSRERLKGDLLNDLHLAVCLARARATGWVVRTNPYEGGSDHGPFLSAGIPAVLDWHFPDRYYHTNLDRPDKTSAAEMANVAAAVGATAMLLASAGPDEARDVVNVVAAAAEARLDLELRQSRGIIAAAADRQAAEATEREVFAAWQRWYREALESVTRLPAGGAGAALDDAIRRAAARVDGRRWTP